MRRLWEALYDAGAEIVLSADAHNYERFAPQNPRGQADPAYGLRQFVVGTGGHSLKRFGAISANSEVRHADSFGILLLTLHAVRLRLAVPAGGTGDVQRLRQRRLSWGSPGSAAAEAVTRGRQQGQLHAHRHGGRRRAAGHRAQRRDLRAGGADTIDGGAGNDVILGGDGADRIAGGQDGTPLRRARRRRDRRR